MEESGFAGIVEAEEQKLRVLVQETKRGEDIVDYGARVRKGLYERRQCLLGPHRRNVHQLTIHMLGKFSDRIVFDTVYSRQMNSKSSESGKCFEGMSRGWWEESMSGLAVASLEGAGQKAGGRGAAAWRPGPSGMNVNPPPIVKAPRASYVSDKATNEQYDSSGFEVSFTSYST